MILELFIIFFTYHLITHLNINISFTIDLGDQSDGLKTKNGT